MIQEVFTWWQRAVRSAVETSAAEELFVPADLGAAIITGFEAEVASIDDCARLAVKLVQKAKLKTYPTFSHGMAATEANVINTDILDCIVS